MLAVFCVMRVWVVVPQVTWDPDRYLGNRSAVPEELGPTEGGAAAPSGTARFDHEQGFNVHEISKTVHSKLWWAYLEMLYIIHSMCDGLTSWAESCACHAFCKGSDPIMGQLLAQEGFCKDTDGPQCHCRMHGRRAPEMVAGQRRLVHHMKCFYELL